MSRMRIEEVEIRDADIFEILLDNFPDMIHSIDDKGNIVYTNKTAETLLGYSSDELLAMMLRTMSAPATNFVGVLAAVPRTFVQALSAIKDQKDAA